MKAPVKYVADIAGVREVSLRGSAELGFWQDRLRAPGLTPANLDGAAEILIVAAEMKYAGIRFRELSISVGVCVGEEPPQLTPSEPLHDEPRPAMPQSAPRRQDAAF